MVAPAGPSFTGRRRGRRRGRRPRGSRAAPWLLAGRSHLSHGGLLHLRGGRRGPALHAIPDAGRPVPGRRGHEVLLEEAQVDAEHELAVVVEVLDHLTHAQVPDFHCHVVGGRDHLVLVVRVRLHAPHGELVAVQHLQRARGVSQVEDPQRLVHAAGDHEELVVLAPVDGEDLVLVRRYALHRHVADVQVHDVQPAVARHGGQAHGPRRGPDGRVGELLVRPEGADAHALHDVPDPHGVVPGGRRDQALGVEVPVHAVHLRRVPLQRHDGPLRLRPVEELHRAVALARRDHVLVGLAPGAVVDPVLREPVADGHGRAARAPDVEDMEPPVPHDAVVLGGAHSDQVRVEGRELAAVAREGGRHPGHRAGRAAPGKAGPWRPRKL
mmetsp:Transcript_2945/g.8295  ORF Transcript_2945/g.8295 Transcript_2945/m.8295 type:complete len:383 (-) Transcript_2945:23-1171(-)